MEFIDQIKRERDISFNDSVPENKEDDGNLEEYKVKIEETNIVEQFLDQNMECFEAKFENNDGLNAESQPADYWGSKYQPNIDEPSSSTSTIKGEDEFIEREHSYVENNSNKRTPRKTFKIRNRIRNYYVCIFCGKEVRSFPDHIFHSHSDEIRVKEILALDKLTPKRRILLDKLRREGDKCDPYQTFEAVTKRQPVDLQAERIFKQFAPNDPLRTSGFLKQMSFSVLSDTVMQDETICEYGRHSFVSSGDNKFIIMKRDMRRLAKLLITARSILYDKNLQLIDILVPSKFSVLIQAAELVAECNRKSGANDIRSMTYQMGGLIKGAVNAALSLEIKKVDCRNDIVEKLRTMVSLVETDWVQEISTEVPRNLTIYGLIPAAENIKKFEEYLKNLISDSKAQLLNNPTNSTAYCKLMEGLFCSIMVFNRRRLKEIQLIVLDICKRYDSIPMSVFERVLSETERILFSHLKTVMIRSSKGMVPILIDESTAHSIIFLIKHRHQFELNNNIYLFGIPKTNITINGYAILRQHTKIALGDVNQAFLFTCMRFRKHLATIAQIFRMDKNDLKQLAEFLEFKEETDSKWYQLPDDVQQTAKISKLLMLYEQTELESLDGNIVEDFTYLNEEKQSIPYSEMLEFKRTLANLKSTKRTRVAENSSRRTKKNNIGPQKGVVTKLIYKNPKIFKKDLDDIEVIGNENLGHFKSSTENQEETMKSTDFTNTISTLATAEEKMDITEEFALHKVKEEKMDTTDHL